MKLSKIIFNKVNFAVFFLLIPENLLATYTDEDCAIIERNNRYRRACIEAQNLDDLEEKSERKKTIQSVETVIKGAEFLGFTKPRDWKSKKYEDMREEYIETGSLCTIL